MENTKRGGNPSGRCRQPRVYKGVWRPTLHGDFPLCGVPFAYDAHHTSLAPTISVVLRVGIFGRLVVSKSFFEEKNCDDNVQSPAPMLRVRVQLKLSNGFSMRWFSCPLLVALFLPVASTIVHGNLPFSLFTTQHRKVHSSRHPSVAWTIIPDTLD